MALHIKSTLDQMTNPRLSVPKKALSCFSRQSNGPKKAQIIFICTTGQKNFGRVDKSGGNLFFENDPQ